MFYCTVFVMPCICVNTDIVKYCVNTDSVSSFQKLEANSNVIFIQGARSPKKGNREQAFNKLI